MWPLNNHLIIELVEAVEETNVFLKKGMKPPFVKARLLRYPWNSPNRDIWQDFVRNMIWVRSSHIIEIKDEDSEVLLIPESAVLCGYKNERRGNRNYNESSYLQPFEDETGRWRQE